MTSFQRLLRGLNVLNRYSGVTEVSLLQPYVDYLQISIPVSTSLKLDPKDVAALTKLGWSQDSQSWVFLP